MKSAIFVNFTDEDFIGYWDGKPRMIKAGDKVALPDYLARHFAKHLTNRELLRINKDGSPAYPNGEKMTSPKRPEDVPFFTNLFNRAYVENDNEVDEGSIDEQVEILNGNDNEIDEVEEINDEPKPKKVRKFKKKEKIEEENEEDEEFEGEPIE